MYVVCMLAVACMQVLVMCSMGTAAAFLKRLEIWDSFDSVSPAFTDDGEQHAAALSSDALR